MLLSDPSPKVQKGSIKVLTLNIWGLPDIITTFVYKRYKKLDRLWPTKSLRMKAISERLGAYDVVFFQEMWVQKDREYMRTFCKELGFEYHHTFSSGVVGSSGLMVISKYPIHEVFFYRYSVNGRFPRVDHGDFHAGKGFGVVKINFERHLVTAICTHTIARYSSEDHYKADRISQMWELVRMIKMMKRNPDELFIVTGDLNCTPDSLEYGMLTKVGNLRDSYLEINGEKGYTSVGDERLDYVLYGKSDYWKVTSSAIVLTGAEEKFLFSDHFGMETVFTINEKAKSVSKDFTEEESPLATHVLQQTVGILSEGIKKAEARKTSHIIRMILALMVVYLFSSVETSGRIYCIYATVEFFVGFVVVESEISALKQSMQEIKRSH